MSYVGFLEDFRRVAGFVPERHKSELLLCVEQIFWGRMIYDFETLSVWLGGTDYKQAWAIGELLQCAEGVFELDLGGREGGSLPVLRFDFKPEVSNLGKVLANPLWRTLPKGNAAEVLGAITRDFRSVLGWEVSSTKFKSEAAIAFAKALG